MKFVRILQDVLIKILPISILLHIVWTSILLAGTVSGRTPYIVGDSIILGIVIISVLKSWITYSDRMPLEYYSRPGNLEVGRPDQWMQRILVAIGFIGAILMLYSVRLQYVGPLYDGTTIQQVSGERITAPMFSDEWVIAGYIADTARKHALPTFNIFDDQLPPVYNFLAPLVIGMAGIGITTGLDVFEYYWLYVFIFQIFFVFVFYIFLRACKISSIGSLIGVVLLVFLPESNFSPGIWIMLPAYIALPFLFLAYLSHIQYQFVFAYRFKVYAALSLVVAFLAYPPYLVLAIVYAVLLCIIRMKWTFIPSVISGIGLLTLVYFTAFSTGIDIRALNVETVLRILWDPVVHARFAVSTGAVWSYIPFVFFGTTIVGIYFWFKSLEIDRGLKEWMAASVVIVLSLLGATYYGNVEVILSHQRVVFLAWILMIILTAFCIDAWKIIFLRNRPHPSYPYWALGILIGGQVLFLTAVPYTTLVRWKGVFVGGEFGTTGLEVRPVATKIFEEDVRKVIVQAVPGGTGTVFASPYVSLALGALTSLRPLATADAYISLSGPSYAQFLRSGVCEEAERAGWLVVHTSDLDKVQKCQNLVFIRQIPPVYHLYRVDKPQN